MAAFTYHSTFPLIPFFLPNDVSVCFWIERIPYCCDDDIFSLFLIAYKLPVANLLKYSTIILLDIHVYIFNRSHLNRNYTVNCEGSWVKVKVKRKNVTFYITFTCVCLYFTKTCSKGQGHLKDKATQ